MEDSEENKNTDDSAIPKIRTFQTDARRFIKDKNLSPVQMVARSYSIQQRQGGPIAPPHAPMTWQKKLLIGGEVLVVLAIFGGVYMFIASRPTPPPKQNTGSQIPTPLVFAETQIILEVRPGEVGSLQKQILFEKEKKRGAGSLAYLPVVITTSSTTKALIPPPALISLLGWSTSSAFTEQLTTSANMFIYFGAQGNDVAFIWSTKDFERTLASLFGWEKSLPRTLRPYLTNAPDTLISRLIFENEVIKNHNARVAKTEDGRVIVGYAIFNKKYVVIATSREALATILGRLVALPPQ